MVLLLSWDARYRFRDRVTVAPITTRIRGLDAEVFLDHNDGLEAGCVVNLDVIATVPRSVLDRRVAQLTEAKMRAVERAIHLALGIGLPCEVR
jgi:mRNA interferase MazF